VVAAVRRSAALTAAATLVALSTACGGSEESDSGEDVLAERAIVEAVVDGDTIELRDGRRVRLLQIDAPEVAECYAEEATAVLREISPPGREVELERDPDLDSVDEHGRLLRYLRSGGKNVNLRLVRQGAAAPYFFRGDRGRYADELMDAATDARDQRRGLWTACPDARLDPSLGALTGPA
jgi:micrococcal nuclease